MFIFVVKEVRMKTLGQTIKNNREALRWSKKELADKIGVSLPQIVKYEDQGLIPKMRTYLNLRRELSLKLTWIELNEMIND